MSKLTWLIVNEELKNAQVENEADFELMNFNSIDYDAFRGFKSMTRLNLSSNKIDKLNGSIFLALTSLQKLDLSKNQLSTVGYNAFRGISNLIELNLYDNRIKTIEQKAFYGLDKTLKIINLSANKLVSLPAEIFKGLDFVDN